MPSPSQFYPPTPAKYAGEKHIPLPNEDDYGQTYSPSCRTSSPMTPMTPNPMSPNVKFSPLFSPLASPALNGLPQNGTTLHILLNLRRDSILDLASSQFTPRGSDHLLGPATNPPKPSILLTFAHLPVTIPITPTFSKQSYVTVIDVLWGLYSALREVLSGQQQKQVPMHLRQAVSVACYNRGGASPIHLDLLAGATQFIGLRPNTAYGSDGVAWEIVVK